MNVTVEEIEETKNSIILLIDTYRSRCLWYLRENYYPRTKREFLNVLDSIEKYGDMEAFKKVRELKKWLSLNSSVKF